MRLWAIKDISNLFWLNIIASSILPLNLLHNQLKCGIIFHFWRTDQRTEGPTTPPRGVCLCMGERVWLSETLSVQGLDRLQYISSCLQDPEFFTIIASIQIGLFHASTSLRRNGYGRQGNRKRADVVRRRLHHHLLLGQSGLQSEVIAFERAHVSLQLTINIFILIIMVPFQDEMTRHHLSCNNPD